MARNRAALRASLCLNPHLTASVSLHSRALVSPSQSGLRCVARSFPRNQGNGVLSCGPGLHHCPRQPNANPARRHPCEPVAVSTLDALLAEAGVARVDVVKIDVEGAECHVLEGAQRLLGRLRPRLLQVEGLRTDVVQCVREQAARHGYLVHAQTRGADQNLLVYRTS